MLVDFTGGLSSLSHAATHSMSSLHLNSVQLTDNGNYTCQPSGLQKVRHYRDLSNLCGSKNMWGHLMKAVGGIPGHIETCVHDFPPSFRQYVL